MVDVTGRINGVSTYGTRVTNTKNAGDEGALLKIANVTWFNPDFEDKSMSQWFDMYSTEDPSENTDIQIDGLRESVSEILDLVRSEATLISSDRVFLGGISQGCATAIHALLFGGIRLGGFIGFSSWLPFEQEITTKIHESGGWSIDEYRLYYDHKILNSSAESTLITSNGEKTDVLKTPVFLSHSADDGVVSITNGERLSATLERLGMVVSWKRYEDGGHWIHEIQGVSDIVQYRSYTPAREINGKIESSVEVTTSQGLFSTPCINRG
ncbi:uncharacterized protein RSE6_09052 [Rhynchosporium secalis]|uniref:Phospholipase/carboxylesterase/thioesterase domain-containing protein n=1 Tax=Rhynchosporium secalis TaxID=38038 RepID=A0A1E1MGY2_RHYSE|nr:uncharacterized protein RSE6_09052 [Rhynchosporium secalis]